MPSPPVLSPLIEALITSLIASARDALAGFAPGAVPADVARRFLRWMIEPAEAMLRRWIWMLAAEMPARPSPAPARAIARSAPAVSARPRAPDDPHVAEQRLHRRLDALIRAHADPAAEARRLAALAARLARLTLNLEFASVPGAKSPVMAGHVREEIEALNAAAGSAYARLRRPQTPPPNTS